MGAARRLLDAGCDVTLLECLPRLGGDCYGIDVPVADGGTHRVDVGVSDFNVDTFVRIRSLLDELGLSYAPICQDASFMTPRGRPTMFSRDGQLHAVAPELDVTGLSAQITRFNAECIEVLDDSGPDPTRFDGCTLGQYLRHRGYDQALAEHYLYPRAIGCFSMPDGDPADFPIQSLVRFWRMHGLVGGGSARRMSVVGGMHVYCSALERVLTERGADIRCGTRVIGIVRRGEQVEIRAVTRDDEHLVFWVDHVVVATNPNEALPLLEDPSAQETAAFAAIPYQRARLVIHTDPKVMPSDRRTWGAYNYIVPNGVAPRIRPTITFFPNRMLGLPAHVPDVFVTMNPAVEPAPDHVIAQRFFEHPVVSTQTAATVRRIDALQGRRTWFAGSYLAEPFLHEQAHGSGEDIATRLLGAIERPAWSASPRPWSRPPAFEPGAQPSCTG